MSKKGVALSFVAGGVVAGALAHKAARAREASHADGPRPRLSALARSLDPYPGVPATGMIVPSLPAGRVFDLAGRGEVFARHAAGPRQGAGPPLLLLHGWMATADLNWFPVIDALAERHPVVAPDHRGHGRGIRAADRFTLEDCADDAAALLRHLGMAPAVVVGYSMGGPIALLLWQRHPDLVSGLVLEATAMEFSGDPRARATWSLMGLISVLLRWDAGRYLLFKLLDLQSGRGVGERSAASVPPDLMRFRAWAEGEFRRGDASDMAEAGRALGRFDARGFAAVIDVPTVVVITTRDGMVAPVKQRALAAATHAEVFEFEGDHDAVAMQGEAFAKVTLEAIAAVTRMAGSTG